MANRYDLPFVAMVLGVGIIALAMITLTILSVNNTQAILQPTYTEYVNTY